MRIIVLPVGRCRILEENESGLRFPGKKIWRFTACTTPYNKPSIITVPKKEILIVLPYLGIQSKIVTRQLKPCIYKFYGCFNPTIIFRNTRRIKSDSTAPLDLK